jgi:allantoin racemase
MAAITIHVVTPIVTKGVRKLQELEHLTGPLLKITNSILDNGPSSIESTADEEAAVPGTVKRALEAELAGADAIIIDCVGDPGVEEARQVVTKIPVFGPGETSMRKAAAYGKFSIVTVADTVKPMLQKIANRCAVQDQLTSIRVINVPVLDIDKRPDDVRNGLQQEALKAVVEEGVVVVILGCTGFFGYAQAIEQFLKQNGHDNVLVLDPLPVTVQEVDAQLKAKPANK